MSFPLSFAWLSPNFRCCSSSLQMDLFRTDLPERGGGFYLISICFCFNRPDISKPSGLYPTIANGTVAARKLWYSALYHKVPHWGQFLFLTWFDNRVKQLSLSSKTNWDTREFELSGSLLKTNFCFIVDISLKYTAMDHLPTRSGILEQEGGIIWSGLSPVENKEP